VHEIWVYTEVLILQKRSEGKPNSFISKVKEIIFHVKAYTLKGKEVTNLWLLHAVYFGFIQQNNFKVKIAAAIHSSTYSRTIHLMVFS